MPKRFHDREEAGRALADLLGSCVGRDDIVVLALPRGGVPVAYEIAQRLGAPLDVIMVRKVGLPGQEELAVGAVATGNVFVRNDPIIAATGLTDRALSILVAQARSELEDRHAALVGERTPVTLDGKTVILVDDGVATGSTFRAAIGASRARRPKELLAAIPVGAADTIESLRDLADQVVCPVTPTEFRALSLWYRHFDQVPDETVRFLLAEIDAGPKTGASTGID